MQRQILGTWYRLMLLGRGSSIRVDQVLPGDTYLTTKKCTLVSVPVSSTTPEICKELEARNVELYKLEHHICLQKSNKTVASIQLQNPTADPYL